jgi:penicillin amidase
MWIALAITLVIIALVLVTLTLLDRALPITQGTLVVPGLEDEVTVIRDRWGVPHIYAESLSDLFFAQGYVHAQDRLWQMELNRRIGSGRLAEIFGEMALDADRFIRTVGFRRAAEADLEIMDEETRSALEAYAAGVNAFLDAQQPLTLEFTILRFKPQPWSLLDTLTWGKVMAWNLSINWDTEILRARLMDKLGVERAAELEPMYPYNNPTVIPSEVDYGRLSTRILEQYRQATSWLGTSGAGMGSNNWVVDGTKSVTGKPLLANDPHLGLQMPSIWYENHLVGGGIEVTGVSFPGVPGVIIGHNAAITWGVTNGFPDVQDLYVEKLNPEKPLQYEYQGEWHDVEEVREEIRVKGRPEPVIEEVTITRHGPIISNIVPPEEGKDVPPLALRWTASEPGTLSCAVMLLQRAANWEEFTAALRYWDVPAQNFVYADVEGNIGYYLAGRIPIRAQGMGLVPVPGWTGEYEWTGWIPFEELPHTYNPPQHYVATANNRVVGDDYPYFITVEWMNGYRARRICDLLESKKQLAAEDFAAMHMDFYSIPGRELSRYLAVLKPEDEQAVRQSSPRARRAVELIRAWDFNLTADSVAGTIFEAVQRQILRLAFADKLGPELAAHYLGTGFHPTLSPVNAYMGRSAVVLLRLLENETSPWFADAETGESRTRDEFLLLALEKAIAELETTLGEDMSRWQWGRLHQATLAHPLGQVKPLNLIFNRGPFPIGGDTDTVHQTAFIPGEPYAVKSWCVSYRQIVDVSNWGHSLAIHTNGQSGQPGSRHYADMIPLWRNGEYHPMLWERAQIESAEETTLVLSPE